MKRKIILQGNKSFTLTLPIDWVRNLNLKSGDEVDVEESPEGLTVKADAEKRKKEIVFTIPSGFQRDVLVIIKQIYRQGYDRIVLKYKDEKVFDMISDMVEHDFVGVEVIDKKPNKCVLEVVVDTNREKFDIFFRKMFQIIKESFSMIKEKEDITKFRRKFEAYQSFCKRYEVTLKIGLIEYEYYSMLSYMMNIQADLHKLNSILLKKKIKVSKPGKEIFNKIAEFFALQEDYFFKKNLDGLSSLNKDIRHFFYGLIDKLPKFDKKELFLVYFQITLARRIYAMISPMMGIIIYKKEFI